MSTFCVVFCCCCCNWNIATVPSRQYSRQICLHIISYHIKKKWLRLNTTAAVNTVQHICLLRFRIRVRYEYLRDLCVCMCACESGFPVALCWISSLKRWRSKCLWAVAPYLTVQHRRPYHFIHRTNTGYSTLKGRDFPFFTQKFSLLTLYGVYAPIAHCVYGNWIYMQICMFRALSCNTCEFTRIFVRHPCGGCACVLVYCWPPQFVDIDFSFRFRHFSTLNTTIHNIQSREHHRPLFVFGFIRWLVFVFNRRLHTHTYKNTRKKKIILDLTKISTKFSFIDKFSYEKIVSANVVKAISIRKRWFIGVWLKNLLCLIKRE